MWNHRLQSKDQKCVIVVDQTEAHSKSLMCVRVSVIHLQKWQNDGLLGFSWYGEGALAKCVLHNRHNWMESISTLCTFRQWVEIALRKCMAITVFGTCAYNQPSKQIWWKFWLEMSIDIKYLHCFTRKTNNTLNSVNSMTWIRYAFNPLKMSIINAHAYNFLIFKPNEYIQTEANYQRYHLANISTVDQNQV